MKKNVILPLALFLMIPAVGHAEEMNVPVPSAASTSAPADSYAVDSRSAAGVTPDELMDQNVVSLGQRVADLEARLANLERENRFQEERMRRFDRSLTDLRRRTG